MKITVPTLLLTIASIFGFLPLALSNNNLQTEVKTEQLSDSTKLITKKLPTSVYHISTVAGQQKSIFDQMNTSLEKVLEVEITTDLQNLIINKNTDDYQPAFIEMNADGQTVNHELKVKPRGKYRRKICDFPPLKLNFSKEELIAQGLNPEFDKLKLVTHCVDSKVDSKDNVLREYLTYQLYNELTDHSFRTILVKIKYVDLHNSAKPMTRYGFLIEDKDEMAARLNGKIKKGHTLETETIAKTKYNLTAMFQYMIGNEDWDAKAVRNVKVVQLLSADNGAKNNIIVPYDFDFSGVVNAPYAIPDIELKHETVKQRHFFGDFKSVDEFTAMSNHFLSRKKAIIKTVRSFKRLSADSKIEIEDYLLEFFATLENEEQVADIFLKQEKANVTEAHKMPFVKK